MMQEIFTRNGPQTTSGKGGLILRTWSGDILFYDTISGYAEWGILRNDGSFESQPSIPEFSRGWTQVLTTGNHYLFFYNATSGVGALGELINGFKTLWEDRFKTEWMVVPSSNGAILFYDKLTGEGYTGGFDGSKWVHFGIIPPTHLSRTGCMLVPLDFWISDAESAGSPLSSDVTITYNMHS